MPVWRGRPRPRILVSMRSLRLSAVFPKERHKPQPEHVKGSDERNNEPDQPIHPAAMRAGVSTPQNFVFAKESGQRWKSRDRKRCNRHRPKRPGDLRAQATHAAHVLFAADCMNYR